LKRKVIQIAGSTQLVSLPRKWCKEYDVQKGQELDVEEQGSKVIISCEGKDTLEKIKVDFSNLSARVMSWTLASLHKKGYDEIEILYNNPKAVSLIQDLTKSLFMGFAVIEQTEKRCVIRSLSKDMEAQFEPTLRRAFLVMLSMAKNSLELIKNNNLAALSELNTLEATNNQLTNFCERILVKNGYNDYKKTCFMYIIAWNLESVCDVYKYLCNFLSEPKHCKKRLNEELVKLYEEVNDFTRDHYELFYKFDMEKVVKLTEERKRLLTKCRNFFKKEDERGTIVLNHLMDIIYRVSDFSPSIISLNF